MLCQRYQRLTFPLSSVITLYNDSDDTPQSSVANFGSSDYQLQLALAGLAALLSAIYRP